MLIHIFSIWSQNKTETTFSSLWMKILDHPGELSSFRDVSVMEPNRVRLLPAVGQGDREKNPKYTLEICFHYRCQQPGKTDWRRGIVWIMFFSTSLDSLLQLLPPCHLFCVEQICSVWMFTFRVIWDYEGKRMYLRHNVLEVEKCTNFLMFIVNLEKVDSCFYHIWQKIEE